MLNFCASATSEDLYSSFPCLLLVKTLVKFQTVELLQKEVRETLNSLLPSLASLEPCSSSSEDPLVATKHSLITLRIIERSLISAIRILGEVQIQELTERARKASDAYTLLNLRVSVLCASADGLYQNVLLELEASTPLASLFFLIRASASVGSDDQVAVEAALYGAKMLYLMSSGPIASPAGFSSEVD